MKTKLYVCSLLVFILAACGNSNFAVDIDSENGNIIGGKLLKREDIASRYVVLLYDNVSRTYCTGTLIHKNVVLTAAHCVGQSASQISVAFGLNPMSGAYDLRTGLKSIIHENYSKTNSKQRNDLALLSFKGDMPISYRPINVIDKSFPLEVTYRFTAAGYGRTTGVKTSVKSDTQGSGVLRAVDLEINSFTEDKSQFYVTQYNGLGICNGDSGGPALMRYNNKDYVVGVISAISWSVPSEVSDDERSEYLENKDYCKDKSIYMNLQIHSDWVRKNLKKLL